MLGGDAYDSHAANGYLDSTGLWDTSYAKALRGPDVMGLSVWLGLAAVGAVLTGHLWLAAVLTALGIGSFVFGKAARAPDSGDTCGS
jgi:hypothetical protein